MSAGSASAPGNAPRPWVSPPGSALGPSAATPRFAAPLSAPGLASPPDAPPSAAPGAPLPHPLPPLTAALYTQRLARISAVSSHYTDRQFERGKGVSQNIVMKIVGDTGSSYVVPKPDLNRYYRDWETYERRMTEEQRRYWGMPVLHYVNSPEIRMSATQRQQQREGRLPGCIANCHVPPIGSVKPEWRHGRMMGTKFPDADDVMRGFAAAAGRGAGG